MSQRSASEHITYMSNLNRMLEMQQGGCGVNQISGCFKDNGISIEPHQVQAHLDAHRALCSTRLPKSESRQAIQNNAQNKPFDTNGFQPA